MGESTEFNIFICCGEQFNTPDELKAHLTEKHGITEYEGERRKTQHIDATEWHQTDYEWTIGDVKIKQSVRFEREDDDIFRLMALEWE